MPGDKPVRLLVKLPVPVPLVVWLPLVVGLPVVFQTTPRAVMEAPPSLSTVPPELAVVDVMEVTPPSETNGAVTAGSDDAVVKTVSPL